MTKYYFEKYNILKTWSEPPVAGSSAANLAATGWYKSYSWDAQNKRFVGTGGQYTASERVRNGDKAYQILNTEEYSLYDYTCQYGDIEAGYETTWTYQYKHLKDSVSGVQQKGSYIGTITADYGAYPSDGVHTDGYWYVVKGQVNSAPTIPGVFTQPTGDLAIGDSKVISWGTSTDAENNLQYYALEVSINGGTWTLVNNMIQSTSYSYTIPTANTIKFRVKAVDVPGLSSTYRESGVFTVTKPKYYWSKYNCSSYNLSEEPVEWGTTTGQSLSTPIEYFTNYTFNRNLGFQGVGTKLVADETPPPVGAFLIYQDKSEIRKITLVDPVRRPTGFGGYYYLVEYSKKQVTKYSTPIYVKENLIQSGIIVEEGTYPNDGKHTDGYWYVRGSRVNQSIAPPSPFTSPEGTILKKNTVVSVLFGASSVANVSYEVDYRYNQDAWASLGVNSTLSRQLTITTDTSKKTIEFRVRAKNTSNVYSDYIYSSVYTVEHNVIPTVVLNTNDNQVLYENSSFVIDGTANDTDDNQSVTVYFQIDDTQRKVLGIGISKTPIVFNKQLVFKSGKIFDGETAITDALTEGPAHTLKVWATDSEGGISQEQIRTFHVVPNRAPALTINPIDTSSCTINNDSFTVSGTCSDPDGNDVVVTYRLNKGLNTEIHRGKGGSWSFNLSLQNLVDGPNVIVVEVVDSFGSKVNKEIKLNKNKISTPTLSSVVYYNVKPANGTAKGVLLWIQRQDGLTIDSVEISMVLAGEQENFVPMPLTNTAALATGLIEDEFYFKTTESKDNIVVKLHVSRTDTSISKSIKLISGVFE